MEIERHLKRKQPTPAGPKTEVHLYGVRTIYLEDLLAIHQEAEKTQEPYYEKQRQYAETMELTNELLRREASHNAKEARREEPNDWMMRPALEMENEEFEFNSLDEVGAVERVSFKEFTITGRDGFFRFHIDGNWAYASINRDDQEAKSVIAAIERVLRRRQNRLVALICNRKFSLGWLIVATVCAILDIFSNRQIFDVGWSVMLWAGIFTCLWFFVIWANRSRVVVPRFMSQAKQPAWKDPAILIGIIGLMLTAAGIIVAVIAWLNPTE